ncbi:winged helix-turn-helix transcriptional regulator [Mycolicibacterium sp. 018/SC-01/001]|uniref:ArsR/SmtB family transcription factor n=1 Tax=Mycolicibacterium sp. 018/SC-01/001 TaxID=2592069 RepID=UPI001180CFB1|nr:helix-turn-helix domain-containing protein [Mycolicibacterium sp. 018/SC-01/001]TRW87798.1 winged helix-turn-helix transcriptional regulator [Mycolicibacterium sp. 018/SC-01/001]
MIDGEHPDLADVTVVEALRGLADATRLRIVAALLDVDRAECAAVYGPLGLSKSNATFHFRVLRQCGLLERTREGQRQYAALRRQEFEDRFPGLLAATLGAFASPRPPG